MNEQVYIWVKDNIDGWTKTTETENIDEFLECNTNDLDKVTDLVSLVHLHEPAILETISNYVKQTELPNQKVLVLSLSCTEKAMCGRISSLISRKSGLRQTDPFTSHSYGYQQPSFTRQFIKIAKNQNNITRKKINTLAYPKKIKKGKLKQSRKHAKIHAKKHVKKYAKKTSSKTFKYKK